MGTGRNNGRTRHHMRVSISTARNTGGARSTGPTGHSIRENLMKITLRDRGFTNGLMAACTVATGLIIRCTGKGCLLGPMVEGTKAAMYKIKNKATARLSGLMARSMWVIGLTADSTVVEYI
jgi:hypothetical protein